jgi:hypothetical protein
MIRHTNPAIGWRVSQCFDLDVAPTRAIWCDLARGRAQPYPAPVHASRRLPHMVVRRRPSGTGVSGSRSRDTDEPRAWMTRHVSSSSRRACGSGSQVEPPRVRVEPLRVQVGFAGRTAATRAGRAAAARAGRVRRSSSPSRLLVATTATVEVARARPSDAMHARDPSHPALQAPKIRPFGDNFTLARA